MSSFLGGRRLRQHVRQTSAAHVWDACGRRWEAGRVLDLIVEHLEFEQGVSSPCVFRHPTRNLVMSVHGDDFITVGAKCDLDWLESR